MSPHYMCTDKEYLGKRVRMKLNHEVPTVCAIGLTVLEIELQLYSTVMPPNYMCIDILFHNEAPEKCVYCE